VDQNELSTPDSEESGEETHLRGGRASGVRAVLQEEIESGKLTPGTQLDERALATRFQVSRTPVREALQQLAVADLVRITPRHGASVTRLTVSQMRAIMETVGELESVAAKLSARRVDDDLRRQLDQAMDRCQEAAIQGGPAEYTLANHLFHDTIYAGSRNPYIAELIRKEQPHAPLPTQGLSFKRTNQQISTGSPADCSGNSGRRRGSGCLPHDAACASRCQWLFRVSCTYADEFF